jgi:anaerobic magnesium-protoporphyrin IX monomethyl ester cyclase
MKVLDCLFIGHNEMSFPKYERIVRTLGCYSEAYRDLKLNFFKEQGEMYTFPDAFNASSKNTKFNSGYDYDSGNFFSATIAYLGSYLNRRNLSFQYINTFQKEKDKLQEIFSQYQVLSVAIPTTFYTSTLPITEIINYIKIYDKEVKIIVGGPFISSLVRSREEKSVETILLAIGADYYINSSQGETALVELVESIKVNEKVYKVKNLLYKCENRIKWTESKVENNLLNENPIYWNLFKEDLGLTVNFRTAISCPFSCSFCGFPQHAGKYQVTDVAWVEKELMKINEIKQVKGINITDDTFNVPLDRFKTILRMMIKNKFNLGWNSYIRCQFLDEEAIQLMKESGCEGVFLGIESADQSILTNMNKNVKVEDYIRGINLLKKYEIMTFASFIYGFPGETEKTIQSTIDFIKEYKPDFYRVQLWYCDNITPIWDKRKEYGIIGSQFSWKHNTMDSKTASDYIEDTFIRVKDSIWLPQYNFDFIGIFNLLHRGVSMHQVKRLIGIFNKAIEEGFNHNENNYSSCSVINSMRAVLEER